MIAAEQGIRVGLQAVKPRPKGLQGLADRLAGQQSRGRQQAKAPGGGPAAAEAEAGEAPPSKKHTASPAVAKPEDLPSFQAPASAQHLQLQRLQPRQPAQHSGRELSGELSFAPAVVESPSQGAMEGRADRGTLDMLFAPGREPGERPSKEAPARSVDQLWCGHCTGGGTTAAGLKVLLPGTYCLRNSGQLIVRTCTTGDAMPQPRQSIYCQSWWL